jgi:hypothetical protein
MAVAGPAFSRLEAGVALRKGNESLLKAIDGAIAAEYQAEEHPADTQLQREQRAFQQKRC